MRPHAESRSFWAGHLSAERAIVAHVPGGSATMSKKRTPTRAGAAPFGCRRPRNTPPLARVDRQRGPVETIMSASSKPRPASPRGVSSPCSPAARDPAGPLASEWAASGPVEAAPPIGRPAWSRLPIWRSPTWKSSIMPRLLARSTIRKTPTPSKAESPTIVRPPATARDRPRPPALIIARARWRFAYEGLDGPIELKS